MMPGSEQSSICDCAALEDEFVLLRVRWTICWHLVVRVFLHAAVTCHHTRTSIPSKPLVTRALSSEGRSQVLHSVNALSLVERRAYKKALKP